MDRQKDLLKLCKPLFVKLTRLSNSEVNKWKQDTKNMEHSRVRRRALDRWKRRDCRYSKSHKIRNSRNLGGKCILNDSDDELSECQTFRVSDSDMSLDKYEHDTATHQRQNEIIDSAFTLPKKNMPSNDKLEWKCEQKRRRISQSSNRIAQKSENTEALNKSQSNSNIEINHETPPVNLTKEIKIISSRLEDSDDPQVERWRSKKKTSSLPKSKSRMPPKLNTLDCTVCSIVFDSKEQLSNHIFKHTQRELQDAYKAAKIKLRESDSNVRVENGSDKMHDCDIAPSKHNQSTTIESPARKEVSQTPSTVSISTNSLEKVSETVPMVICSCHTDQSHNDASVQIEMVLFCETCHVLFRRSECFETHYRLSSKCNTDRTKGRTPKLFCSTCRVILDTLSNMRRHLEEHASINFHGTVTFVCNICRVVFFGVGTVFCTHWFNHEKDPTFVASRYSFPKLCVSTQGTKPSGSSPDEQYFFVAEYVCRSCKLQFSSECELTNHVKKGCEDLPSRVHTENKFETVISHTSNLKSSKSKSAQNRPKIDALPLKPLDIITKWICEFCNECFPSRIAFEEHSSKHLQDDGYPGYSCVFQLSASTAFICNVCRGVHDSLRDLMKHWVTHEVIKFICSVCGEKCSSYNSFQAHISLACWKFKPDCRVWFNRQQHACKICTSTYKTAEELTQHYKFNHVAETETNIANISSSQSLPIVETPPTSETSTSPRSDKNKLTKIVTDNSSEHVINQTDFISLNVNNSTDTVISTQPTHLDIENLTSEKSPLQELTTIRITTPNLCEESPISCKDHSTNDSVSFNNNIQNGILSEIPESTSASTAANLSKKQNINTYGTPEIGKTANIESLNVDNASIKITMRNTCLHGSNVIITNPADLHHNNNSNSNNDKVDDRVLRETNIGDLQLYESMSTTVINTLNPLNSTSMVGNISELGSGGDTVEVIPKPKISENGNNIADKVVEVSENDEPEIIEIPNNSTVTSVTHEAQLTPVLNGQLENQKSTCNTSNVRSLHQNTTSNNENICIRHPESTDKKDECSNSDAPKCQGFLRVKKFTELQAVRNYVCNQCGAAFDNNKSLDEHTVAHNRRLTGNEKHPTMMAALILPQVNSNKTKNDGVIPTSILSSMLDTAENRVLSYIPQRNTNAEKGVATSLVHGEVSNKSHNLPTMKSVSNIQNVQHSDQQCYACPFCLSFRCSSVEDFTNHLSISHPDVTVPIANPSISHSLMNEMSRNKQKIYSCRICKCSTLNRETIVEHVRLYHLNVFQQNQNIVPRINTDSVQQVDLTVSATEGMNSNIVPPYKCSLCPNYRYNTMDELAQHFQRIHQSIIQKDLYHPYVCNICCQRFQTYSEFILHLDNHQTTTWT